MRKKETARTSPSIQPRPSPFFSLPPHCRPALPLLPLYLFIHADRRDIAGPHKQVNIKGVVRGRRHVLAGGHEGARQAPPAVGRRHRQRRHVAVPVGAPALHLAQDVAGDDAARGDCGQAALRPPGQVVEVEAEVVLFFFCFFFLMGEEANVGSEQNKRGGKTHLSP